MVSEMSSILQAIKAAFLHVKIQTNGKVSIEIEASVSHCLILTAINATSQLMHDRIFSHVLAYMSMNINKT